MDLVKGGNAPLPDGPVDVRCSVGSLRLLDGEGRLLPDGALRVDLPHQPHDVSVVATLPGGAPFGTAGQVVVTLSDPAGQELVRFDVPGLGPETTLVCVELYRRGDRWKVRAVGQGYTSSPTRGAAVQAIPADPGVRATSTRAAAFAVQAVPVLDLRAALLDARPTASLPPALDLRAGLPALDLRRGPVTLRESESVRLVQSGSTSLDQITLGVGWAPAQRGRDVDLDASVVALGPTGTLVDFVYYRQQVGCGGAIWHGGDNTTGSEGDGDDERIFVELGALPQAVAFLVFTVTSYQGHRFSDVRQAHCRLLNGTGPGAEELVRFTLSGSAPKTAAVMCKLARVSGVWEMTAIGTFHDGHTVGDLGPAIAQALLV